MRGGGKRVSHFKTKMATKALLFTTLPPGYPEALVAGVTPPWAGG